MPDAANTSGFLRAHREAEEAEAPAASPPAKPAPAPAPQSDPAKETDPKPSGRSRP